MSRKILSEEGLWRKTIYKKTQGSGGVRKQGGSVIENVFMTVPKIGVLFLFLNPRGVLTYAGSSFKITPVSIKREGY